MSLFVPVIMSSHNNHNKEKRMKEKRTILFLIVTLLLVVAPFAYGTSGIPGTSQEKATEQECLAKAIQAVKLIQEIGEEAAMAKIMDKNGPFIWKDTHVYCIDSEQGFILAHPRPGAIGFSLKFYGDIDGNNPYDVVLDNIETRSKGWISYVTDHMGRGTPRLKRLHFRKVPGQNIIVCSGYYPTL